MMTQERVQKAKPDLLLLAPGPINRGVELTPEVADGKNSAILDQVTNGLAVRMAVLHLLSGRIDGRSPDWLHTNPRHVQAGTTLFSAKVSLMGKLALPNVQTAGGRII